MPTLHIKNLHCIETEDNWGSDDAYIKVNGGQIWGPVKINDNEWRDVNADAQFTDTATIELYEVDDTDSDDYLGTWVARGTERGEVHAFFHADDCNYEMIYEVRE